MRRPLFAVCLCLVMFNVLRIVWDTSPGGKEGTIASLSLTDGEEIFVTGRVYQKDSKYFYLDSVVIQQTAASPQQSIPVKDNFIGEQGDWREEETPLLGSIVAVRGSFRSFQPASNPGEFDSAAYYRTIKIGGKLSDVEMLSRSDKYSMFKEALYALRKYWEERLYRIFPDKEASIMSTIILGNKAGLDSEIKELYQRNGIVHILSISGLHITMIGMGLYRILRKMEVPPWLAAAVGGGILICYGIMTGMGISAVRAVGMYLIRMLAEMTGRTYDMLTALGVMAALMTTTHPEYLQHSGFLLSFSSVMGIGTLFPALALEKDRGEDDGGRNPISENIFKRVCRKGQKHMKESALAGISITLSTLPVQLWFYYEVPVYSVLLNLLVLPFMSLLLMTGLTAMLVPGLGIAGTADCLILTGYEKLCECFDSLPFHTWNPGRPDWRQAAVYYGILLFVIGSAAERKNRGKRKKRPFRTMAILAAAVVFLGIRLPRGNTVVFLDVGQGDGICVQTDTGEVYLFDCGSSSRSQVGKYVLKPFLKYYGISRIDAVFLSHSDTDHCNGVMELLLNGREWGITVDTLVLYDRESLAEMLEELGILWQKNDADISEEDICGTAVAYIHAGDTWQSGAVSFTCLHPPAGYGTEGTNAASECFYVDFGDGSLLLTGDVEGEGEELLLDELKSQGIKDITVLKTAHHGSRNSTSEEFLKQVSPAVSIISCGRNNRYGHPHEELLERMERMGGYIFKTAESGAVSLHFGKNGVEVYSYITR